MPQIFLPYLGGGFQEEVGDQPGILFHRWLLAETDQCRTNLNINKILTASAQFKAEEFVAHSYFDHISPTGETANQLVTRFGFKMHHSYPSHGNNGESVAGGYDNLQDAYIGLLMSFHHRQHVLGLTDFFCKQTEYGFGYAFDPNSPYRHYYVIHIYRAN